MVFQLHPFSLVVVRHPTDRSKYAVVEEKGDRGLWIAGGHVDPGETFEVAAVREAKEELGINVTLVGVLRVEHNLVSESVARMRVVFIAEVADPVADLVLKSKPDHESKAGHWMTVAEIAAAHAEEKLRGDEILKYCAYVDAGKPVYPLTVLTSELAPMP